MQVLLTTLKGCYLPPVTLGNAQNDTLWIVPVRHSADIGYARISASRLAGNGHKAPLLNSGSGSKAGFDLQPELIGHEGAK